MRCGTSGGRPPFRCRRTCTPSGRRSPTAGSDPAVVGKPIHFAEINTTVAGVAPRDFDTPHGADFWFTVPLDPQSVAHA